ncbi:MAG TPA: hypothetical protein VN716_05820 [Vicinamibacterales bacterium]|nr:hypothetical protein [Vicinamibacterales bacterium]
MKGRFTMLIVTAIRWIMLISGILTATMVYAAIDPEGSMRSTFGETLPAGAPALVIRNWGALIALVGAMLIYGAFNVSVRPLVLVVAGVSKAVFIGLVLSEGTRYLGTAGVPVAVDSVMIVLFAWYLAVAPRTAAPSARAAATV